MNLVSVVENMSQEMYLRLKHAVEIGKWPEGTPVNAEQRESALQLTMAYQAKHLNSDEILTIGPNGEMVAKSKRELKEQFKSSGENSENEIARFKDI